MKPAPSIHDGNRRRAPYAQVGRLMRDTLERAHRLQLGPLQSRVLNAVLITTVSWSKITDTTTTRALAELAYGRPVDGRERDRVGAALAVLEGHELIRMTRTGKGRGARLIVSVGVENPEMDAQETPPPEGGIQQINTPSRTTETPPPGVAHRGTENSSSESNEVRNTPTGDGAPIGEKKNATREEVLVARVTDYLRGIGARAPHAEITAGIHAALQVHDWRVVDEKIGRAISMDARSWTFIRNALGYGAELVGAGR